MACVYGFVPEDQDLLFKLYLNLEDSRNRNCFDQSRAMAVALGQESMPDEWISAVALTPEEKSLWRRHEMKREMSLSGR